MIYTGGRVMRVFISGEITGTDDYMERFAAAEEKLTEWGYDVINPARVLAQVPFELPWDKCMDITLTLLRECDLIYMLKGWEQSTGAWLEHSYAEKQKLGITYEHGESPKAEANEASA